MGTVHGVGPRTVESRPFPDLSGSLTSCLEGRDIHCYQNRVPRAPQLLQYPISTRQPPSLSQFVVARDSRATFAMFGVLQKLALAIGIGLSTTSGARGFSLYQANSLDVTLGPSCINALAANIDCIDYTRQFMQLRYRTSLENITLTDQVCTGNCGSSLKSWFDTVTTQCAGKSLRDTIPTKFGGYIYAGWNETCVKDPKTKQYCNGKEKKMKIPKLWLHFICANWLYSFQISCSISRVSPISLRCPEQNFATSAIHAASL